MSVENISSAYMQNTHTHTDTNTHTHTDTNSHTHTDTHARTPTHARTHTNTNSHTHTDTHPHTHTDTHTHTHTDTHTHTHTPKATTAPTKTRKKTSSYLSRSCMSFSLFSFVFFSISAALSSSLFWRRETTTKSQKLENERGNTFSTNVHQDSLDEAQKTPRYLTSWQLTPYCDVGQDEHLQNYLHEVWHWPVPLCIKVFKLTVSERQDWSKASA